jgi:hypothetical protein
MEKGKKLQLNRETIRNLSDESLEQVAGGKRKGGDTDGVICISFVDKTACINVTGCNSNNTCLLCSNLSCVCP